MYRVHRRSGMASVAAGNRVPVNEGFTDMMRGSSDGAKRHRSQSRLGIHLESAGGNVLAGVLEAVGPSSQPRLRRPPVGLPDRVAGLGMHLLWDPEAALNETNRIVDDRSLCGIALPAAINGRKLSTPETESIIDRIDEAELTAFIHSHGRAPQRRRVVL